MPRGVNHTRVRWTPDMIEDVRLNYPELGPKPFMEKYGLTFSAVMNQRKRLGVKHNHRNRESAKSRLGKSRGYTVNHDYFCTWSPNVAYALGYIYADGCITTKTGHLKLGCCADDEELIIALRDDMGSNHRIQRRVGQPVRDSLGHGRKYISRPKTEITICSKLLIQSLVELHGLQPAKSKLNLPMPYVPEELLPHFIRGYFDGDGFQGIASSGQVVIGFCGQSSMMTSIHGILCSELKIRKSKILERGPRLSTFANSLAEDVISIFKYLYPAGSYLFMRRRREWFDTAFDLFRKRPSYNTRLLHLLP